MEGNGHGSLRNRSEAPMSVQVWTLKPFRSARLPPWVSEHSRPVACGVVASSSAQPGFRSGPSTQAWPQSREGGALPVLSLSWRCAATGVPCVVLGQEAHRGTQTSALSSRGPSSSSLCRPQGCTGRTERLPRPPQVSVGSPSMEGFGSGGAPVSSFVLKHPRRALRGFKAGPWFRGLNIEPFPISCPAGCSAS